MGRRVLQAELGRDEVLGWLSDGTPIAIFSVHDRNKAYRKESRSRRDGDAIWLGGSLANSFGG